MKPPHISIVIPAYNEERFIEPCLDSLMNQNRQPDAIYIVDNNCTDSTIKIAQRYPNVQIITETTQGICTAVKRGFDVAADNDGIILRCDADCRPKPDWVESIEEIFARSPTVSGVTGPGIAYDTNKISKYLIDKLYMKPYFYLTSLALGKKPLFGSNFAIKANAWKKITKHTHLTSHQNIHEDMDISFHLEGEIMYNPSLVMPISARPFRKPHKLPGRYIAGFRSIFIHWPEQAPWRRFTERYR